MSDTPTAAPRPEPAADQCTSPVVVVATAQSNSSDTSTGAATEPPSQTPKRKPPPASAAAPKKVQRVPTRSLAKPIARRLYTPGDSDDGSDDESDGSFDSDAESSASSGDGDDGSDATSEPLPLPIKKPAAPWKPAARPAQPKQAARPPAPARDAATAAALANVERAIGGIKTAVRELASRGLTAVRHALQQSAALQVDKDSAHITGVAAPHAVYLGARGRGISFEVSELSEHGVLVQVVNLELCHPDFGTQLIRAVAASKLGAALTRAGLTPVDLFVGMCGALLGQAGAVDAKLLGRLREACHGVAFPRELVGIWTPQLVRSSGRADLAE